MDYHIHEPETAVVTTNLWGVDVADLTGDVTHVVYLLNDKSILNAERITVQIVWSGLDAADAVFMVKTRIHSELAFCNEQPDESESNATQVTLVEAAGNKIFHLTPANYQALQLFLDKNTISEGAISVAVSVKF